MSISLLLVLLIFLFIPTILISIQKPNQSRLFCLRRHYFTEASALVCLPQQHRPSAMFRRRLPHEILCAPFALLSNRIDRPRLTIFIFICIVFLTFLPNSYIAPHLSASLHRLPSITELSTTTILPSYFTGLARSNGAIEPISYTEWKTNKQHSKSQSPRTFDSDTNSLPRKPVEGQMERSATTQRDNVRHQSNVHQPSASNADTTKPGAVEPVETIEWKTERKSAKYQSTRSRISDSKFVPNKQEGLHTNQLDKASVSESTNATNPSEHIHWALPPSLKFLEGAPRDSQLARTQESRSWMQPLVISTYVRPRSTQSHETDIFVYVTGVTMGNFNRQFIGVGCLIGDDVYPITYSALEVYYCQISRRPNAGEKISLVLRRDDVIEKALAGPVEVSPGVIIKVDTEALIELPDSVRLSLGQDESKNLDDYVVVRSQQTVPKKLDAPGDQAEKLPRYEICAATMMKQFPNLLDDWIDYHRRIGVDMVYLLDNAATIDLKERYEKRADVETLFWPWKRSQVQGLSAVLVALRGRCEWLLLHDADEYVMIGIGEKGEDAGGQILKKLLARRREEGFDDVRFGYVTMGPSGNVYMPKNPAPQAYVELWHRQKLNGKAASLTAREWRMSKVHYNRGKFLAETFKEKKVNQFPVTIEDGAALIHYQFRSMEESLLKKSFESPSIGDMNLGPRKKPNYERLKNPPGWYRKMDEERRYEHFRDIWQAVTKATGMSRQTIVREVDGKRETREFDLEMQKWVV